MFDKPFELCRGILHPGNRYPSATAKNAKTTAMQVAILLRNFIVSFRSSKKRALINISAPFHYQSKSKISQSNFSFPVAIADG
ncbi:hypothetical protein [Massilia sp. TWR1-2-2]|uniref:hypothetical protein n=1 Tax=Massilia sp. TWR1-2-2 TaxID=2804584 RepID=UPI003CF88BD5